MKTTEMCASPVSVKRESISLSASAKQTVTTHKYWPSFSRTKFSPVFVECTVYSMRDSTWYAPYLTEHCLLYFFHFLLKVQPL